MKYHIFIGRSDFRASPEQADLYVKAATTVNALEDEPFEVETTVWPFIDTTRAGEKTISHPGALVRLMIFATFPFEQADRPSLAEGRSRLDEVMYHMRQLPTPLAQ